MRCNCLILEYFNCERVIFQTLHTKKPSQGSSEREVQRRTTVQAAILKFHKHTEVSQAYITKGISYGVVCCWIVAV